MNARGVHKKWLLVFIYFQFSFEKFLHTKQTWELWPNTVYGMTEKKAAEKNDKKIDHISMKI